MPIKATVWSILVFLPLMPLVAELTEFRNGERADAEAINGNFRALNQALESTQQAAAACEIFSRQGNTTVACPEGSSLSSGGFALADNAGNMLASHPTNNGWRCEASSATDPENLTCYARCCGVNGAMLARNLYCSSNYCWDSTSNFPNYNIHTHYAMTLTKGAFKAFPMEIDESFVFPPESIGAASLLVRYQGEDHHVTNLDADCLAEDPDRPWSECFTAWQNSDILEAAIRSGTLLAAPGPTQYPR